MEFLTFSAEAQSPTGYYLMKILNPVSVKFNNLHMATEYSDVLQNFFICPICLSPEFSDVVHRERKYISQDKKSADIRLYLNYTDFVNADDSKRRELCLNIITEAVEFVTTKIPNFSKEAFLRDVSNLIIFDTYTDYINALRFLSSSRIEQFSVFMRDRPKHTLVDLYDSILLAQKLFLNKQISEKAYMVSKSILVLLKSIQTQNKEAYDVIDMPTWSYLRKLATECLLHIEIDSTWKN